MCTDAALASIAKMWLTQKNLCLCVPHVCASALAAIHDRFKVFYTLTKPGKDWSGYKGFVDKTKIAETLPAPSDETLIMVCGPPPMMKAISGEKVSPQKQGELSGLLKEMQYSSDNVFKF